jgi:hypothetical protein
MNGERHHLRIVDAETHVELAGVGMALAPKARVCGECRFQAWKRAINRLEMYCDALHGWAGDKNPYADCLLWEPMPMTPRSSEALKWFSAGVMLTLAIVILALTLRGGL